MDSYYLNLAVYDLEDFLKTTNEPYYDGEIRYGRPEKGHGWRPADARGNDPLDGRSCQQARAAGSGHGLLEVLKGSV